MEKTIRIIFLSMFLNFFIACKQASVNNADLIGVWQGEKQNGTQIQDLGFNSIKVTFTNDSVEVIVDMKAFGGQVSTKSVGPWVLTKNILKTKFGDHSQECLVILNDKNKTIIFKPDLFFKPESVKTSQYKKDD